MADAKKNVVKVVARNDGQYMIRIVAANGKTVAESDRTYKTKGSATTAAKNLVTKGLELDQAK
jgi:uncharacterized protein YegP (UPF0339 family)